MKIYFSTESGRQLEVVEGEYVPLVGDVIFLDMVSWVVVSREFDTDPPEIPGRLRKIFARVQVK